MTPSRSLSARVTRLRSTRPGWIADYGLWKLHRLEDRFPRDTGRRLGPLRRDLDDALRQASGASDARIAAAREDYRDFRLEQEPYVGLYAVADTHLTELQFVLTRLLRPTVVVETGVWRGLSSWTILAALERNGTGTLVSIDFPPLEEGQRVEVGHLVPDRLRARWDLRLGPSRQLLPAALEQHREIDLFVHDSDHTYFNMRREFALGWRHLSPSGVLLSDDVDANHAFVKFARRVRRAPIVVSKERTGGYLGVLPRTEVAAEPVRASAGAGLSGR